MSRQQADDYLKRNTGFDDSTVAGEIDRYYYSRLGQALSYMIGQLEFLELSGQVAESARSAALSIPSGLAATHPHAG